MEKRERCKGGAGLTVPLVQGLLTFSARRLCRAKGGAERRYGRAPDPEPCTLNPIPSALHPQP